MIVLEWNGMKVKCAILLVLKHHFTRQSFHKKLGMSSLSLLRVSVACQTSFVCRNWSVCVGEARKEVRMVSDFCSFNNHFVSNASC